MKCSEIMTDNPSSCLSTDHVTRAARLMETENVGPVPVVEDQQSGRLIGIVTDRDLTIKVLASGRDPRQTLVGDVMSKNLVTCHGEDDVERAMSLMEQHLIRRIPVVDYAGRLVGILAQADVARSLPESRVGEMVEEISGGRSASYGRGSGSEERVSGGGGDVASAVAIILAGASLGAGLMYLFDAASGGRRRALIRDKATSAYTTSGKALSRAARDASNRASGLVAQGKSQLAAMTETQPAPEAGTEDHSMASSAARLQGESYMQASWGRGARLLAGAVGGGLAVYGMRRRSPLGKASATLGMGLLTRGVTNREMSSWSELLNIRHLMKP